MSEEYKNVIIKMLYKLTPEQQDRKLEEIRAFLDGLQEKEYVILTEETVKRRHIIKAKDVKTAMDKIYDCEYEMPDQYLMDDFQIISVDKLAPDYQLLTKATIEKLEKVRKEMR